MMISDATYSTKTTNNYWLVLTMMRLQLQATTTTTTTTTTRKQIFKLSG